MSSQNPLGVKRSCVCEMADVSSQVMFFFRWRKILYFEGTWVVKLGATRLPGCEVILAIAFNKCLTTLPFARYIKSLRELQLLSSRYCLQNCEECWFGFFSIALCIFSSRRTAHSFCLKMFFQTMLPECEMNKTPPFYLIIFNMKSSQRSHNSSMM